MMGGILLLMKYWSYCNRLAAEAKFISFNNLSEMQTKALKNKQSLYIFNVVKDYCSDTVSTNMSRNRPYLMNKMKNTYFL